METCRLPEQESIKRSAAAAEIESFQFCSSSISTAVSIERSSVALKFVDSSQLRCPVLFEFVKRKLGILQSCPIAGAAQLCTEELIPTACASRSC